MGKNVISVTKNTICIYMLEQGANYTKGTRDNENDETFPMEVAAVELDDSQLVTLRLESANSIRFQAHTGAQCNVIPLEMY